MDILNIVKKIFGPEKNDQLEDILKIIEEILSTVGTNMEESKLDTTDANMFGWLFKIGIAQIFLYLIKDENKFYIKIISPLTYLPKNNILPFYRKLLEENLLLNDLSIGVDKNIAVLFCIKNIEDIDYETLKKLVENIAETHSQMTEKLVEEFQTKIFE